jgi:hypothetical protein
LTTRWQTGHLHKAAVSHAKVDLAQYCGHLAALLPKTIFRRETGNKTGAGLFRFWAGEQFRDFWRVGMKMYRSWLSLMMLAAESQQVIMLRTLKIAAGGPAATLEANRMVNEKLAHASSEGSRLLFGASPASVITSYRRKVRANARRLTKAQG